MFITIITVLFLALIYNVLPERIQQKIRNWTKDTVKWALVCSVLVGMLYAMFIFLPGAIAEELPEPFIIEQFQEVECEHDCLKLTFDFHGNTLSFYWKGPLDLTRSVWVMVWNNVEVIDANYVELP